MNDSRGPAQDELDRARDELTTLNRIGMALMTERDTDTLLRRIVDEAMRLTCSDAGGLYLLERGGDGTPRLRFKLVRSESMPNAPPLDEVWFPVDSTSLAGHAAKTRQHQVIDDVHSLPADARYAWSTRVERLTGYYVKSLVTIPMVDHRDEVVGVLQLANRKVDPTAGILSKEDCDRHVVPYSDRDVQLSLSLAGQAAVSIENAQLYEQIEHLLESFVKAAVTAIDQRDPATAGHSVRVAALVTDLAEALERVDTGRYRDVHFTRMQLRELRYAALLHDFGKVGVQEEVLVKARKLPPFLWERVAARFDLIRCTIQMEYQKKRAAQMAMGGDSRSTLAALDAELGEQLMRVDRFESAVKTANEPTLLPEESARLLADAAKQTLTRPDGRIEPYLTAEELHYLRIPRGSLDERERHEVEGHTRQTLKFLSQIPWTDDLKHVAAYAWAHHEKLDGTGYPRRVDGKVIPLQTRLITIADIFDALTAADRPYKPAVTVEKALEILQSEAEAGLLDAELVRLLIESQVYRRILEEDWRHF